MSTSDFELLPPPDDEEGRELWLQHAAGFILFEDARQYALDRIDADASETTKRAVQKGIDDALYGLMMIIDGVTGSLSNADLSVDLKVIARLVRRAGDAVVQQLDLFEGDGMCMGYHGWRDGDFGKTPVAKRRGARRSTRKNKR